MLILSRKIGESIVIDGRIVVKVVRLDGDTIKLGIEAPTEIPVHRQEVYDEIQRNNQEALTNNQHPLPKLAANSGSPSVSFALHPASTVIDHKQKITIPATRR